MITAGFQWQQSPADVFLPGFEAYIARVRSGIRAIADKWAPIIAEYMKANHLWQNITGDAEAGLNTIVEQISIDMVQIVLSHGVSYGKYLELANAGVWGILAPSLDVFAPKVWQDVVAMMS